MSKHVDPSGEPDLGALLEIAELAAGKAALALREERERWSAVEAEIGREVKVAADRHAEALILETLQRLAPYPILSEERGWIGDHDASLVWTVDPLDGSVNYIQGFPHCAVSVALLKDGRPILGVVDCFLLGEHYAGIVDRGAQLNGRPIRVSAVNDPARGILQTGIPARVDVAGGDFLEFMQRIIEWRKVRMIGSAASALASVAAGKADAYRESGAMIWDVAGGCALVEAAGGSVQILGAGLDEPLQVCAANALLIKELT